MFLNRLLPDITFEGSSATAPKATFTLKMKNSAGGNYLETAENNVTQSAAATSTVVEQFTEQVFIRLRGRAFSLRVESSDVETQWRLGTNRVDLKVDGKK